MPEDFVRFAELLELYGGLLTDKQRRVFAARYQTDLTLAEIAEQEGVSRQAASDLLSRSARILENYEQKLGLLEERRRAQAAANAAADFAGELSEKRIAASSDWDELKRRITSIIT